MLVVMNKFWNSFKKFFTAINYSALWDNISEVAWLTGFAFIPLIINIIISSLSTHCFLESIKQKIIPGEILSYCLSFLAPSLYLLVKTHGKNYKLPFLKLFSLTAFATYFLIGILLLIVKNNWVDGIDSKQHSFDLYFQLSIGYLFLTIFLRIYSSYHGSFSNWSKDRNDDQKDFNNTVTSRMT